MQTRDRMTSVECARQVRRDDVIDLSCFGVCLVLIGSGLYMVMALALLAWPG